jgi:hypothetical protein
MKSHNEGIAASDAKYTTLQKFLQHKCLLSKDHVVTSWLTSPIWEVLVFTNQIFLV